MAFGPMNAGPAPGMPESRTAAFQGGQDAGLMADSARYNAMVPKGFHTSSVLQPVNPVSSNGMAQSDYSRMLPGMQRPMMSFNGAAEGNQEQLMLMRLRGEE